MEAMFMNSKNSGTYDPHRLLLNLTDAINLEVINMLYYENLAFTINGQI